MKEESIKFANNFDPKMKNNADMVGLVNHGFQIINLSQMILKTQESFNKMGRYYIDHKEVLSLFMMYLDDLNVYNSFIKNIARVLVRDPEDNNP